MENLRRDYLERMKDLFTHATTKEHVTKYYDEHANIYDNDMYAMHSKQDYFLVLIDKYCPGTKDCMSVLDVGCGTGLTGEQLKSIGFKNIDGVDASSKCLEVAESKGVYRELICSYFSKQPPLDIPSNSYDMIVTFGTFVKGHLPYDCLHEMIRLVRTGGIVVISSRSRSFDGKTIPEYVGIPDLIQTLEDTGKVKTIPEYVGIPDLIQTLEDTGKVKTLSWESSVPYIYDIDGTAIVLRVL